MSKQRFQPLDAFDNNPGPPLGGAPRACGDWLNHDVMVWVRHIVAAAVAVMIVILFAQLVAVQSPNACSTGNTCIVGIVEDWGTTCVHKNRVNGAPCHDTCHTNKASTRCNGAGACVSARLQDCKGYCALTEDWIYDDSTCDLATLFPLKPYFIQDTGGQNDDVAYEQNDNSENCFASASPSFVDNVCAHVFSRCRQLLAHDCASNHGKRVAIRLSGFL
jgi:hypothetical protein